MNIDWAEKYRPKKLIDVMGNPEATSKLKRWAESWERSIPKHRAVILMGDAGVGKTSSALALAGELGWGAVEMNASDLRNADAIKRIATQGAMHETFTDTGEFVSTQHGGRKLIILDEADNIFGKEDYGGVQAISATIRETFQPIILIVNDYYALTRRAPALKTLCLTIRFQRIQRTTVVRLLRSICQRENITASNEVLIAIAEHSSGDLRSAINDLQSLALGKSKISEKDVTVLGYRDSRTTIFKALAGVFKAKSFSKALESTYDLAEDPGHVILWIDENLPLEYKRPEDLASAYQPLSRASIYLGRVSRKKNFKFWSYANDLMTAGVALSKKNTYNGYTRYQFPSWLSKMSKSKGLRAVQKSLFGKLSTKYHTSPYIAKTSIFPYFKYLFENEKRFSLHTIHNLELEAEEIAYILGDKGDSETVKGLLEESKNLEEEKEDMTQIEGLAWDESGGDDKKKDEGQSKQQRNLSEF